MFLRTFLLWLQAALVGIAAAQAPLAAQVSEARPVHELLGDRDGDAVPDRLGGRFTIIATATAAPRRLSAFATSVPVQDSTAGILLFTRDSTLLAGGIREGDRVRASGTVSHYRGTEQLTVDRVERLAAGEAPPPRDVLAADLSGERYSGQLVRVVGEVEMLDRTESGRGVELILRDRSGAITVYLPYRFLEDGSLLQRLLAAQQVEVVGIAGQYQRDPPFTSGYRLAPRQPSDLVVVPVPPYRALGIAAAFLTLALLSTYLWLRHRSAERRAREMTALTESLRRSESALRQSETRYALAAAGANDGLWDWDLRADQLYLSPRWKAMLGYTEDEVGTGAAEWLDRVHAEDAPTLRTRLDAHLSAAHDHLEVEYRIRARDGSYRWMLARGLAARDESGSPQRLAGSQTDIHGRKLTEQRLAHDATHDALTQLPNRVFINDQLRRALSRSRRRPSEQFAVLFLDFDGFKRINDTLGHQTGDQLLIAVARRLEECLRPGDRVARLGGDEFVILVHGIADEADAAGVAGRIRKIVNVPFEVGGHELVLTVSTGITLSHERYGSPEEILRDADLAMYRAKESGKDRFELFDVAMHAQAVSRLQVEWDLRKALENDELRVYFQPIVSLPDERTVGFEALVRWQHPTRGLLPPADFLLVAEETGQIIPLGRRVFREACRELACLRRRFPSHPDLFVSVNVSGRQLLHPSLPEQIDTALAEAGLPASALKLEITENIFVEHASAAERVIHELHGRGIRLQMDDFGTGYSSLSYLHRFPLSTIKIDRSFVDRMTAHARSREIVRTIIALAHSLQMDLIAEGVETPEQAAELAGLACHFGQGYLFSRPREPESILALDFGELQLAS